MSKNLNDIKRKVNQATTWSFLTEILAKIIVPVTNAILAHLLMPEAFGLVATINMVITFTDVLTEAGFGQYLIQHDFDSEHDFDKTINVAFWSNLFISSFMWVMIFVFRGGIASLVGSSGYEVPLVVACLSIPLTTFSSVPIALLQKKYDYRSLFINRLAGSLTPLVVSTTLAVLGFGYWSLIIGTLCSNVVKSIVLIIRSRWHPRFFYSFVILKKMFSFCIWILLEAIAMWACTWIDIFIVSNYFGSYYTGLYKTAQTTVTGILSVVTASINSIVFVTLSKLKMDKEAFRESFYKFQFGLAILVIPLGVGIFVFRDLITYILLGVKWMEASEFLGIWGICTALVATLGTLNREALRADGKPKLSFFVQTLHLLFILPIIYLRAKEGYGTLIYVRSFAYLESIFLLMVVTNKAFNFSPVRVFAQTIWPIVCASIMGVAGYLMIHFINSSYLLSFLYVAICIVIYFGLLVCLPAYRKSVFGYLVDLKGRLIKKKNESNSSD